MASKFFTTLIVAATLTSCARDRDVDDYNRDEYQKQVDKMKVIEGSYAGQLIRRADGQNLGPVSFDLKATGRVSGDVTAQKAVLKGKMVYRGNNLVKLVFRDSSFDPDQISFTSTINQGGRDLDVEGTLTDGTLVGQVSIFGFEEESASFKLKKLGSEFSTAEDLISKSPRPNEAFEDLTRAYQGTAQHEDGLQEPVVLRASNLFLSVEDRFFDFMSPQKKLQVDVQFGPTSTSFSGAIWDSANNQLTASKQLLSGTTVTLNCSNSSNNLGAMDCVYQSSERGVRIKISLTPEVTQ